FRAKDEKHVKDVEGTGLGLAFVKEIIHQHNGTIHVESEVGKGSSFSFALPIDFTLPENAALKPAS
ncbi:MAG TPA: ATP-binding protein, partial [bacterium]|nr:ATP-binding protein [bacterium]